MVKMESPGPMNFDRVELATGYRVTQGLAAEACESAEGAEASKELGQLAEYCGAMAGNYEQSRRAAKRTHTTVAVSCIAQAVAMGVAAPAEREFWRPTLCEVGCQCKTCRRAFYVGAQVAFGRAFGYEPETVHPWFDGASRSTAMHRERLRLMAQVAAGERARERALGD